VFLNFLIFPCTAGHWPTTRLGAFQLCVSSPLPFVLRVRPDLLRSANLAPIS
jgi:hypothetical protein